MEKLPDHFWDFLEDGDFSKFSKQERQMQVENVDALKEQARSIAKKIDRIEETDRYHKNKKLEGKAFKYRNNYSCPEKPSDYWWMYLKVIKVTKDFVETHEFQTDQYGKIEIELRKKHYRFLFGEGSRIEIKPAEFDKAWKALQAKLR